MPAGPDARLVDVPLVLVEQLLVDAARRGGRWSPTEARLDVRLRLELWARGDLTTDWPTVRQMASDWRWTPDEVRGLLAPRPSWLLQGAVDASRRAVWEGVRLARRAHWWRRPRPAAPPGAPIPNCGTEGAPQSEAIPPGLRESTKRRRARPPRPSPAPSTTPLTEAEYGRVTASAVMRWWSSFGREWSAVRTLELRGWDGVDILQEVLLSSLTKSLGKSRWDPARSNVDAWAGLVGRSRILHLLQRRPDLRPLALDATYMADGVAERAEDRLTEPMDWTQAPRAEPRKAAPPEAPPPRPLVVRRPRRA